MESSYEAKSNEAEGAADTRLHPRLDGRRPDDHANAFRWRRRARWLRRCLDDLGERPRDMVVLGRDRGPANSELFANLHIKSLVTIDMARERSKAGVLRSADGKATLVHVSDYRASESADLAFAHGVFHYMPEHDRAAAVLLILRSLAPAGLFAVWQANPRSPGVAWHDRVITRDASQADGTKALSARETRRLLRGAGFDIIHTTSPLFFPQSMSWCESLEPLLAPIQLGGEYMVLARKP
jgi:SAM-dependent methyltransferase